jgi:outer membrane protein assembly factor BamB
MGNLYLKGMKPLLGIHTGDMTKASFPKAVAINDNVLYVLSHKKYLRAYNSTTGEFIWKTDLELEDGTLATIPVGVSQFPGNNLLVTMGNNLLYCLEKKTGDIKWKTKLETFTRSTPVISGGRVYVQTVGGTIYAINILDGKIEWRNWAIQDEVNTIASQAFIIDGDHLITQNAKGYLQVIDKKNGSDVFSGSIIKTM